VWLDRLDAEADNLRAVLGWSFEPDGARHIGVELGASLAMYWILRGRNTEGSSWLERIVPDVGPGAAMGAAMAAFLMAERGEVARAAELARRALDAARQGGDDRALIMAITGLSGLFPDASGSEARTLADDAIAAARQLGDWWFAFAAVIRGEVARIAGEHDVALRWYADALTAARRTGDRFVIALGIVNPAHILLARGETENARRYFLESVSLFRELQNSWGMAYAVAGLGGVAVADGRAADAVRMLAAVDGWFTTMGSRIQEGDRVDYERYIAEARQRSGDSFDDLWRAGHALSLDEAVAIAG
jgi:tetratricopeptide (TPR) repeat protein